MYSHPTNDRVLTNVFSAHPRDTVELGRFVLLDSVESNGETWFLARTFEELRALDIQGVLSFSDPVPRRTADGILVMPGHVGTIYQAGNAKYLGRSTPRQLRLLPNGVAISDRSIQKVRAGERGWRYAAEQFEKAGSPPAPEDAAERRRWLSDQLSRLTRPCRHPGNHKYAWCLHRGTRLLITTRPYPKMLAAPPHVAT